MYIKNMVCDRCIMVVKAEAEKAGLKPAYIKLGEIGLTEESLPEETLVTFGTTLLALGFERIDNKKSRIIEKVKNIIVQNIHHSEGEVRYNWSDLITGELHYEYNYISNLFSSVEGVTIEQFIIRQKVEKIKELLFYEEMNLNQIAWKMNYSSPAYLSSQFKKVTGMTPGRFRKLMDKQRIPLDNL